MKSVNETHPYIVELDVNAGEEFRLDEYCEWCEETFGNNIDRWKVFEPADISASTLIRFSNEEDRTWFLMRWAGESH